MTLEDAFDSWEALSPSYKLGVLEKLILRLVYSDNEEADELLQEFLSNAVDLESEDFFGTEGLSV